jgi:diguanylate cyclase (GGDEF)-like protein
MPSEAAAAQRRLGRGRSSERAIGLRETQPSSGGALWFLMVDLDRFKQVNDEHGHDGGDAVLVHVARVLRETVRRQDLVVRWGGEEFVVVARDLGPRDGGAALAERIRAQVAALEIPLPAGGSLRVTCSIGFAPFPFARSTPDALRWQDALTLADLALYHAKHHGRDAAYGLVATRAPAAEAFTAASRDLADAAQRGLVHLFEARHALGPGGLDELDALASSDVVRAAPAESGLVPRLLDDQRTRQSGP